jgi:hypothetical protein
LGLATAGAGNGAVSMRAPKRGMRSTLPGTRREGGDAATSSTS